MKLALARRRAGLLVIDLQDRLVPAMPPEVAAAVLRNTRILVAAAGRLAMPILVTQQYPKGLGATVAPIEEALAPVAAQVRRFDKLEFSAVANPAVASELGKLASTIDQWIIVGMETHVCVFQTARDLVGRGAEVYVATDAVSSRSKANWKIGLGLCERAGAVLTATEAIALDLLGRAGDDDFRVVSKLIR